MDIEEMKQLLAYFRANPLPVVMLPHGTGLVADFTFPAEIVESEFVEPGHAYIIDRASLQEFAPGEGQQLVGVGIKWDTDGEG